MLLNFDASFPPATLCLIPLPYLAIDEGAASFAGYSHTELMEPLLHLLHLLSGCFINPFTLTPVSLETASGLGRTVWRVPTSRSR